MPATKPFFVLAPLDDVTDTVFRRIVASCAKPDFHLRWREPAFRDLWRGRRARGAACLGVAGIGHRRQ